MYSARVNQINYGITALNLGGVRGKYVTPLLPDSPSAEGLNWARPGLQTPQAVDRILPSLRSVGVTEWCLARHNTAPVSEEMARPQRATSR